MLNPNPTVSLGDLVIVYEDYKTMKHVYVKSGAVYQNNFGSFKHDDMVGRPFGHKMASHNGHGFVHLLQPTAELWTASLSHRTQILYIADISMICLQLELLPGHRVIEAGTGSGSLSHGLARSVGPTGHLFTYEFNEARALAAAGEFADNKLAQVTCRHADVCTEGYVYPGLEPASIDAVSSAPPHVLCTLCIPSLSMYRTGNLRPTAAVGRGGARRAVRAAGRPPLLLLALHRADRAHDGGAAGPRLHLRRGDGNANPDPSH
jgi:hypothetical protein